MAPYSNSIVFMISPLNEVDHPAFSRRDLTRPVACRLDRFNGYPLRAASDDPPDAPVVILRTPVSDRICSHDFSLVKVDATYPLYQMAF